MAKFFFWLYRFVALTISITVFITVFSADFVWGFLRDSLLFYVLYPVVLIIWCSIWARFDIWLENYLFPVKRVHWHLLLYNSIADQQKKDKTR